MFEGLYKKRKKKWMIEKREEKEARKYRKTGED
jgi:hypothetical protein